MNADRPNVGLFVTCLVDLMRPSVGFAAVKLLQQAGCDVAVPGAQTCCGQPAYNSGDRNTTRQMALNMLDAFEPFDYVVAPSGSCAGMLRKHYPGLFDEASRDRERADAVAEKTYELISFLTDIMKMKSVDATLDQKATYHDSCSGYRELGIKTQPRKLLKTVTGLKVSEMKDAEICCGFGGTFCVKYPDISNDMVTKKIANIEASGADVLLAGDLGCLMNIAGKLKRQGSKIQVRHVAEVLAGAVDGPAIAESKK